MGVVATRFGVMIDEVSWRSAERCFIWRTVLGGSKVFPAVIDDDDEFGVELPCFGLPDAELCLVLPLLFVLLLLFWFLLKSESIDTAFLRLDESSLSVLVLLFELFLLGTFRVFLFDEFCCLADVLLKLLVGSFFGLFSF